MKEGVVTTALDLANERDKVRDAIITMKGAIDPVSCKVTLESYSAEVVGRLLKDFEEYINAELRRR